MVPSPQTSSKSSSGPVGSALARWQETPLYLRILAAVIVGVGLGLLLGKNAEFLGIPSQLVLRVLGALAPALILLAIVRALLATEIPRGSGPRLFVLLVTNTLVAIFIGLLVANVLQPGSRSAIERSSLSQPEAAAEAVSRKAANPLSQFLENVPKSLLGPLGDDGKVIGVVILALLFGLALRRLRHDPKMQALNDLLEVGFQALLTVLHWVIEILPLAVLGIIAKTVGDDGFAKFAALGYFVVAVLIALALQSLYYLLRIRLGSWPRPQQVLRGVRDALTMAFSTGSSTATMPVTYECLTQRVGLRRESASLGSLVGANFNNDGTALYEAMSALFVAQLLGQQLDFGAQLIVVVMSVIASVGAAGIPEAGLVTMTLVFTAVKLPLEYITILLTVDWFLDRCRTAVNVMGDVTVSCLLDGRHRATPQAGQAVLETSLPAPQHSLGPQPDPPPTGDLPPAVQPAPSAEAR